MSIDHLTKNCRHFRIYRPQNSHRFWHFIKPRTIFGLKILNILKKFCATTEGKSLLFPPFSGYQPIFWICWTSNWPKEIGVSYYLLEHGHLYFLICIRKLIIFPIIPNQGTGIPFVNEELVQNPSSRNLPRSVE